ncbi:hypothetical protein ABT121_40155 [Streptomyces sp. NPDC001928]|uniref:hypothetical protein n=1 Tax=Streptomyces sp. NPDC001928 TaxID=3154404 RepID=UPI00332DD1B1
MDDTPVGHLSTGRREASAVERRTAADEPQPWWMPRRVLTVVSADVDATAGVGAIWIEWRPKSPRVREHLALLEWDGEQWRCVGGGFSSGDDPAHVDVLDVRNGAGVLSRKGRDEVPTSITVAPWISCAKVGLGPDVGHVLIGGRRIEIPEQRRLIAVWTSSYVSRGARPVIVALGHDGAELSRIGPHDSLDTYTWARLREEL